MLENLLLELDKFALGALNLFDLDVDLHLPELERAAQVAILAGLLLLLDLFHSLRR